MIKENNKKSGTLKEIQKILSLSEEKNFKEDEMIFEEGEEDLNFYIILKGNIEIGKKTSVGQTKVIAQIGAGEFLGEGVLSGTTKKPASAKAVTDTTLMVLSYDKLEKLIEEDCRTAVDFLLSVLEAANNRLSKTNTKLLALYEISQLMHMYRDDLNQLAAGLINRLITITDSKDGILYIKNPFETSYRVIYTTTPDLSDQSFKDYDLTEPQKVIDKNGQFLIVNLKDLGILALSRDLDHAHYDNDQLRLLALIAEQAAHTIREASEQAAEKARKMLHRKRFEL